MKVCYFGTFEEKYPRNLTFINGLKNANVSIQVCHGSLKADKASIGSLSYLIKLAFLYIKAYTLLIFRAITIRCDAVIIGYPSHIDVVIFYPIFKMRGIPVFFNPLVSLYDTFVDDRMLFKKSSFVAKLIYFIDKLSFMLPEKVFIDTKTHAKYLASFLKIPEDKFCVVPVGALEQFFSQQQAVEKADGFQILYCGKYIPLHSVETIVFAAKILEEDTEIKFKLIGTGQEYKKIRNLVSDNNIKNIEFIDWMEPDQLAVEIQRSHIVLGIFKKGGKASRVIPNKVYDALAAGAIVITEESEAVKEVFQDGQHLFLVEPENPKKLAEKIEWIKRHYEAALLVAEKGREAVFCFANTEKIGRLVKEEIQKILSLKGVVKKV